MNLSKAKQGSHCTGDKDSHIPLKAEPRSAETEQAAGREARPISATDARACAARVFRSGGVARWLIGTRVRSASWSPPKSTQVCERLARLAPLLAGLTAYSLNIKLYNN